MTSHSSILAWRISWPEEPSRLQSMRLQSDTTEQLTLPHFSDRRVTKIQLLFATFLEES